MSIFVVMGDDCPSCGADQTIIFCSSSVRVLYLVKNRRMIIETPACLQSNKSKNETIYMGRAICPIQCCLSARALARPAQPNEDVSPRGQIFKRQPLGSEE